MIHGENVTGVDVDAQTRCTHYNTELDVIAIKFKCCGRWFPCFQCHQTQAGHTAEMWPSAFLNEEAILCGVCGEKQTIRDYINGNSTCPACQARFNPGCADHYHLYFAVQ
jgi:uncharacterized CHY-type Zn-finger protein